MNNERLNELLKVKVETAGEDHLFELQEELRKAELILPIEITSEVDFSDAKVGEVRTFDEPLRFKPLHLVDDFGNDLILLFSDESEVKGEVSTMVMPTPSIADMLREGHSDLDGVVFNPFGENPIMLAMDTFIKIFSTDDDG